MFVVSQFDGSMLQRCSAFVSVPISVLQVSGLARKHNYHNRWEALIKKATNVLNKMLLLAGKIPRNYIIDQVSTYLVLNFSTCGASLQVLNRSPVGMVVYSESNAVR